MRLIDADKLNLDICIAKSLNKAESTYDYAYSEKMIEKAPTVEAIPVEWIEELSAKLKEEDNFEKAMFLLDMIDVWEEENGNKGRNQNVL